MTLARRAVALPARAGFALWCCLLLAGCSAHVSVGAVDDNAFRTSWQSGWASINSVSKPLNPSGTNPGVCDKGGSASACLQTGRAMIPALQAFASALAAVDTPDSYKAGSKTIQAALEKDVQAITDRNAAITSNDDALFSTSIGEFKEAAQAFRAGYLEFPETTRPTPPPFDNGREG